MFAEGHVRQVEQPADARVVGELPQVLGEMFDGQREPAGLVWMAEGRSGKIQAPSPRHSMQFSVSPRRRPATPWKKTTVYSQRSARASEASIRRRAVPSTS